MDLRANTPAPSNDQAGDQGANPPVLSPADVLKGSKQAAVAGFERSERSSTSVTLKNL